MPPVWRKSSKSTNQGGECVEVAVLSNVIGVRDSKQPEDGHLTLSREGFATLVQHIKGSR